LLSNASTPAEICFTSCSASSLPCGASASADHALNLLAGGPDHGIPCGLDRPRQPRHGLEVAEADTLRGERDGHAGTLLAQQCEKEMLAADMRMPQRVGLFGRVLQDPLGLGVEGDLHRRRDFLFARELPDEAGTKAIEIDLRRSGFAA
jgi:hypothetical protein